MRRWFHVSVRYGSNVRASRTAGATTYVSPSTEPVSGVAFGGPEAGDERVAGVVLPGIPNLHSHAFQRAAAGLTERRHTADQDSFWSWREVMHGFVTRITPDQHQAIAAQLYVEMLKAGYTGVGEFHYLHLDPSGRPYDDPAEMSRRCVIAAEQAAVIAAKNRMPVSAATSLRPSISATSSRP
jgi:cytosine/adenosine deaminase-related metal-dependent hydrolase